MADCNLAGVCFGNLEMSTFLEEKMDVHSILINNGNSIPADFQD